MEDGGKGGQKLLESHSTWKKLNGAVLEAALRHDKKLGGSPVALLDARYIIALAKIDGAVLARRDDLPREAFLDLDIVKKLPDSVESRPDENKGETQEEE